MPFKAIRLARPEGRLVTTPDALLAPTPDAALQPFSSSLGPTWHLPVPVEGRHKRRLRPSNAEESVRVTPFSVVTAARMVSRTRPAFA